MITARLSGVGKQFGSITALAGITIDIQSGVTALLGPNGSGKTTFLRVLATAVHPDRGDVRLLGEDPRDPAGRRRIRLQLGYLPQEPGFYPWFTAYEFVDYIAILHEITDFRRRKAEVVRVLERVGLADQMHRRLRHLSGGQRHRVGLAQALLGEPRLLLLDEPTVGLDPLERLRFRRVVSEVAQQHTVVLFTHLTDDVAAICDRVLLLSGGRIAFAGSASDLVATAAGHVWLAEAPDGSAAGWWRTAQGLYRHIGEPPPGARLTEPTTEDGYLYLTGSTSEGRTS